MRTFGLALIAMGLLYLFPKLIHCFHFNPLCHHENSTAHEFLDVFWINLISSTERRNYMERQLDFYGITNHERVAAVEESEVFLPNELVSYRYCPSLSAPAKSSLDSWMKDSGRSYEHVLTSLCGRKKNSRRELAITISHLQAIWKAVHSESEKRYALILEDDVLLSFNVDFEALVRSAPSGFVMLQLTTSSDFVLKDNWGLYLEKKLLWTPREDKDAWWAGAYIIDKRLLKQSIDTIMVKKTDRFEYEIIAGYQRPCVPARCCSRDKFLGIPPCFNAPRGFHADHFLFRLRPLNTFLSTVPLFASASAGNVSTVHQDHVSLHGAAFRCIDEFSADLRSGRVSAPKFMSVLSNCSFKENSLDPRHMTGAGHHHHNRRFSSHRASYD